MGSLFFNIILFFLVTGCSSWLQREPAFTKNTNFCESAYEFSCNDKNANLREQLISQYLLNMKEQALKEAAVSVGLEKENLTLDDFRNLKKFKKDSRLVAKKRKAAFRFYFSRLNELVQEDFKNRFGDEQELFNLFQLEKIKVYLRNAIQKNVSDKQKQEVIFNILSQIEIVPLEKLLSITNVQLTNELTNNYYDGCGFDGLADNAFAFTMTENKKTKPVIVLCSGAIAAASLMLQNRLPEVEFFAGMLVTLGHEVSHHFDAQVKETANTYTALEACLLKTDAPNMQPEPDRKNPTLEQILADHMGEITADYWGAQTLAEYLAESKLTNSQKIELFQLNYSDLCQSKDDGVHPEGRWRIEYALKIPALSQQLSCQQPQSCQLDGWQ